MFRGTSISERWITLYWSAIDLFHYVIYFENFRKHQHGGSCINLYCVAITYGRLRSGHMTHEKGLYSGRCTSPSLSDHRIMKTYLYQSGAIVQKLA